MVVWYNGRWPSRAFHIITWNVTDLWLHWYKVTIKYNSNIQSNTSTCHEPEQSKLAFSKLNINNTVGFVNHPVAQHPCEQIFRLFSASSLFITSPTSLILLTFPRFSVSLCFAGSFGFYLNYYMLSDVTVVIVNSLSFTIAVNWLVIRFKSLRRFVLYKRPMCSIC